MKEPMSLKDVGRYYKDGKVKETEGGFWLKSDGLIFVVPKEVYLMQNGDILDPMYKYADLDGKLAEWLAEYAQGAEIHYRLGWFERVGDKAISVCQIIWKQGRPCGTSGLRWYGVNMNPGRWTV